ncbi:MAG: hypothetical protein ABIH65_01670 [Nanoarchaeota archaeon]
MADELIFEELGEKERIILLRANGYNVDHNGFILDEFGRKIPSKENPKIFLESKFACLVSGSFYVMDGTPTAISELIRKEEQKDSKDDN